MVFKIGYALVWPLFHILFPFKVIGREKLTNREQGYVVCANHISFLDPVYIIFAMKRKNRIFFMAKQELFENKISAWFFKRVGAFPVNRGAGASGGLKTAESILANGQTLGVFPEGTRSKDGTIGKAKAGAAMLVSAFNTYVLPITLVCKNQKVRPFRKMTLVVGDPVQMPDKTEEQSQREHLRICTAAIMKPIQEGLDQYVAK